MHKTEELTWFIPSYGLCPLLSVQSRYDSSRDQTLCLWLHANGTSV